MTNLIKTIMKKTAFIFGIVALMILNACNLAGDEATGIDFDVNSESTAEAAIEDIDVITEQGLNTNSSGRLENEFMNCGVITRNMETNSITIDFGDGCAGPNGRIRSGKIIIQHNGRPYMPGSSRVVTFGNFKIDSVLVEGVRTITNTTSEESQNPQFTSTLDDGKFTFTDGTFITREATHTRTWFREPNPRDDYASLTGMAAGLNRDEVSYSSEITTPLVFKRVCGATAFIPVSGIKVINYGSEVTTLDFGDGTCNNKVFVTRNGETVEREINIRDNTRRNKRG